jgi:hypothetical protein
MRRGPVALAMAIAAIAIAGCGGDDDETTTATGATGGTGATGASGEAGVSGTVTVDEVASCLQDEGLDATVSDSAVLGIEAEHEKVDVALEDLEQGAVVIVFPSAEDAESEESTAEVAAGVADTQLAGNTIWGVDAAVDDPDAAEAAIKGCVPS